jgi:hypothetical protein
MMFHPCIFRFEDPNPNSPSLAIEIDLFLFVDFEHNSVLAALRKLPEKDCQCKCMAFRYSDYNNNLPHSCWLYSGKDFM